MGRAGVFALPFLHRTSPSVPGTHQQGAGFVEACHIWQEHGPWAHGGSGMHARKMSILSKPKYSDFIP